MANSTPGKHIARLVAACGAGLLGVAVAAQAPRDTAKIVMDAVPVEVNYRDNTALFREVVITQGDIRIQADEAEVKGGLDFENGEWILSGTVKIDAEGGHLRADRAVVAFRDNVIARATITGTPAEFEQLRKDGSTSRGRAPAIDYETTEGTVSFRDEAWLAYGCYEFSGSRLVYSIKLQSLLRQMAADSAAPGGKVRIVIQPQGPSGGPCNGPGPTP